MHREDEPCVIVSGITMLDSGTQRFILEDVGLHWEERGERTLLELNQPVAVGAATFREVWDQLWLQEEEREVPQRLFLQWKLW